MRPLTLTLAGFRSHEDETTISFEDRSFVAIVGPTGSGKSSILDAISFALYGKTPRVKAGTKRLISSRCDSARVRLRFVVEKDEYEITRVLRRKGSAEHMLEDCSSSEKVSGDAVVSERVIELLGLDFEAFCSSVLLAQGKFSRFLEATPADQMKILKGVFRLDQIDQLRDAAKARVTSLDLELAEIQGATSAIPDDLPALLAAARAEKASAEERVKELAAGLTAERALLEEAARADEALKRAEEEAARLRAIGDGLPAAGAFDELAAAEAAVVGRARAAAEAVAAADQKAKAAADSFVSLEQSLGTIEALAGLRSACSNLAAAQERVVALTAAKEKAEGAVAASEARAAAARTAHEAAKAEAVRAAASLRSLEQAHRAHVLRADLAPGEPCPVCEQVVATVPRTAAPSALGAAEKDARRAEKAADAAAAEAQKAGADLVGIRKDAEHADKSLVQQQEQAAGLRTEIEGALGAVDDFAVEVETRWKRLDAARKGEAAARDALELARAALEKARAEEQEFAGRRSNMAGVIVHAAGLLGEAPPPMDAPSGELAAGAEALRATATTRAAAHDKDAAAARTATEGSAGKLAGLRRGLALEPTASIADAHADSKAAAGRLGQQIDQLEKFEEKAKELLDREKVVSREHTLYSRLARDMTDRHFIRFLLEDRRRLLSELGSAQLRGLTGRYRFDDKLEFNVVDELDADQVRDVETLSGGEMFLASLALALGLAEAVARHGGRLQCFFLDEGFGALDPEALDLALDGIEQIVHPDRLIGLVSHVHALAQRVEDKIELERSAEGTTIVRAGATA